MAYGREFQPPEAGAALYTIAAKNAETARNFDPENLQALDRTTIDFMGMSNGEKAQRYLRIKNAQVNSTLNTLNHTDLPTDDLAIPDPVANRVSHPRYPQTIGLQTRNIGAEPLKVEKAPAIVRILRVPFRRWPAVTVIPQHVPSLIIPTGINDRERIPTPLFTVPDETKPVQPVLPLHITKNPTTNDSSPAEKEKKKRRIFMIPFLPWVPAAAVTLSLGSIIASIKCINNGVGNVSQNENTPTPVVQTATPPSNDRLTPTPIIPTVETGTPRSTETPVSLTPTATVTEQKTPTVIPSLTSTPGLPTLGNGGYKHSTATITPRDQQHLH